MVSINFVLTTPNGVIIAYSFGDSVCALVHGPQLVLAWPFA